MDNLISRYRNLSILAVLLFGQVLGLAIQVKRASENASTRLIRIWAVDSVTPLERGIVWVQNGTRGIWRNYFYLRGVRQENRDLKQKIEALEIERVRLNEDAEQAHRLQALLSFKEQYISKTLAAQVIGSSGSEQSRSIYIDKGSRDGIRPDMAVITADGIVGKVLRGVQDHISSVLLINDQTSGVGAILEKSRLQGVLRGTPAGEVILEKVMTDEAVAPGERVLTSGGDRIFPKGLPVGTVTKVSPGQELFLNIRVRPAADLDRLEEVLVITQQEDREPVVAEGQHLRAADILAQRLPSIPDQPVVSNPFAPPPATNNLKIAPAASPDGGTSTTKTATGVTTQSGSSNPRATSSPSTGKPTGTGTTKQQVNGTTKPLTKAQTGASPTLGNSGDLTTVPATTSTKPKSDRPQSTPQLPQQDQPR